MPQPGEGRIVTFHSFTGGSGRTMAIANVAWILAAAGRRVLVADWDLESPGLHRYLHPFLDAAELDKSGGVTDLLARYERAAEAPLQFAPPVRVHWHHFGGGRIDYLPAGRREENFAAALAGRDWDEFYAAGGGGFLDALRGAMTAGYDYTLVDSPPGLGDLAQICLAHLPDVVLACFTLSAKSIEGAARAAEATRDAEHSPRVLPVPMRVDPADGARVEAGRRVARERLAGLPAGLRADELAVYWRDVQVPYQSAYAYEEILATLTDLPGQPDSLLSAYERLAWYITEGAVKFLPPLDDGLRYRAAGKYLRLTAAREDRVLLRHAAEDQVWAEWIAATLAAAQVTVLDGGLTGPAPGPAISAAREITVISAGRAAAEAQQRPASPDAGRPPLAVYTDAIPVVPAYPERSSARLHGLDETEAARALLRLVGHGEEPRPPGPLRFPGVEPACFRAPPRPAGFTGRAADLARLRARLRPDEHADAPRPAASPVVVHGLGGAGKSALAAEYTHRFGAAYDLVWWLDCGALDEGIAALAAALGVPARPSHRETAGAVLGALRRGEPYRRWLIVLDDADDYEQVRHFLPQGAGQVLITSRNLSWGGGFASLPVGVFGREESIVYLRRHVPGLRTADADAVAAALGDLPLAVAEAAAALQRTGAPAAEFLAALERDRRELPAIEGVWDRSLARLRSHSPGAHRLLQLFSVMAPDTATDVVYSDVMAEVLKPYDESVADRLMPATLVQQISRLGLLRPDLPGGRVHVHPLLQRVVRERMSAEDRREARHQVHLVLAGLAKGHDADDPRSWPQFDLIWPHLDESGARRCREEAVRALVVDRVRRLRHAGARADGERMALDAEADWAGHRVQLLQLRGVRAAILRDQGRYADARRLDEEIRAEQEELLGRHHPATLATRDRQAADLRALGHYDDALRLARSTYRAWARVVGAEHTQTLNALNGLATTYRAAGRYRAALRCDERVQGFRPFPGPEDRHPAVLRAAASLGRDLRDAGRYGDSAALLRRLEPAVADAYGAASRAALTVRTSLAVSLRMGGRATEAAPLLEQAYEQFAAASGPAGPDTLACRHSWALTLLATGHVERARAELTGVELRYGDLLGPGHPRAVVARANLALVAWAAGEREPAHAQAASTAAQLAAALPAHHPLALTAAVNLALLDAGRADRDAAARRLAELADALRRLLGESHPETVRAEAGPPDVVYPTSDALRSIEPY